MFQIKVFNTIQVWLTGCQAAKILRCFMEVIMILIGWRQSRVGYQLLLELSWYGSKEGGREGGGRTGGGKVQILE